MNDTLELENNPTATVTLAEATERRGARRVKVAQPIRVRPSGLAGPRFDEVVTTIDVSRHGVLFATHRPCYSLGMRLLVTIPYSPDDGSGLEYLAEVVRMRILDSETFAVALRLLLPTGSRQ